MKKGVFLFLAVTLMTTKIWAIPSPDGSHECPSMFNPVLMMKYLGIEGKPAFRGINNSLQTVGSGQVIVLRVDFSNRQFLPTHDYNHFVDVFTGEGSPQEYFLDQSDTKLNLTFTVSESVYRLPQTSCYYSDNPWQLIVDSVRTADRDINFQQYNAVMILHAGPDQAVTGDDCDIWSMYLYMSPPYTTDDGAQIYDGTIVPEGEGRDMSQSIVGVAVHEFGHNLGLPDLYSFFWSGPGIWSAMASGAFGGDGRSPERPTSYDPWSRVVLEWAIPEVKSGVSEDVELPPIETTIDKVLKLPARGDPNAKEYFLLEYRIKEKWDKLIPGTGMLIWHIDDGAPWDHKGQPASNFHVKPVQADGKEDLENGRNLGDAGDPYPGSAGNRNFDESSTPASRLKNGQPSGVAVTEIQELPGKITARVEVIGGPGSFFVRIIEPVKDSYVPKSSNVKVTARVTGAVVGVEKVTFYVDGQNIGEDRTGQGSPPEFEAIWDASNASEGGHNIRVVAEDNLGNKAEDTITVLIDSVPPEVLITSPSVATWYAGPVVVGVEVRDPPPGSGVSYVEILLDGDIWTTLRISPWRTTLDTTRIADGQHTISATAFDNAGNSATSQTVRFNVDNNKPSVAFINPQADATVSGVVNIQVDAKDGTGSGIQLVEILVDARRLRALSVPPYSASWNTLLEIGKTHSLKAIALDNVGNSASTEITVQLANDLIPPAVSLLSPPLGTKACGTIQITLSASDNLSLKSVNLYEGNQFLGSALASPFVILYKSTAEGRHDLRAEAVDTYDNTSSANLWLQVVLPGHTPPATYDLSQDLLLTFQLPYAQVQSVQLFYREKGSPKPFSARAAEMRSGQSATFRIPKSLLSPSGIEYFVQVQTPFFLCEGNLYSTVSPYPKGDVNLDGQVDENDWLEVALNLGITQNETGYEVRLDVNVDGVIDEADLQEILNQIA